MGAITFALRTKTRVVGETGRLAGSRWPAKYPARSQGDCRRPSLRGPTRFLRLHALVTCVVPNSRECGSRKTWA